MKAASPLGLVAVVAIVAMIAIGAAAPKRPSRLSSSSVLVQLPEGETKRQFIIDCTNCHPLDAAYAYPGGKPRTRGEWATIVGRMIRLAGATTPFPIMAAGRDSDSTAAWLVRHLPRPPVTEARLDPAARVVPRPDVVEYLLPEAGDLPHDVAVDSSGTVIVTGMFSSAMHVLDTTSRTFTQVPIPVPRANPRAVEVERSGDWWVLLGIPGKVARYRPATREWTTHDIGMYAHSVALGPDRRVWFNGHFTRDPEQIGYVDPDSGKVRTFDLPRHRTLATTPGGPIPYELRVAPDGRVWMSELQGHRMVSLDPGSGMARTYALPTALSAPRRFDIDPAGILWIPAYAAN